MTLTPSQLEEISERLRGCANDAENWGDSYEGQRQQKWLLRFAETMREGADTVKALRAELNDAYERAAKVARESAQKSAHPNAERRADYDSGASVTAHYIANAILSLKSESS